MIVFLPHKEESHRDHKNCHLLALEAVNRAGELFFQTSKGKPWTVKTILCYEVWTPLTAISYIEDITDFIALKVEAMAQHQSQIHRIPFDEAIRNFNRYRGIMTGEGDFCECFQLLRFGGKLVLK